MLRFRLYSLPLWFLECVCSCMCEIERDSEQDPICTWILTTTTNKRVWFITSFLLRMSSAIAHHSLWQALHLSGWKHDKHVCVRRHAPAPAHLCYTQCSFFLTWYKVCARACVCTRTYACAQYMSFANGPPKSSALDLWCHLPVTEQKCKSDAVR